jgi:hypothetical protein
MARREVCRNEYDKLFEVTLGSKKHTFDSFERAIHGLGRNCTHHPLACVGRQIAPAGPSDVRRPRSSTDLYSVMKLAKTAIQFASHLTNIRHLERGDHLWIHHRRRRHGPRQLICQALQYYNNHTDKLT